MASNIIQTLITNIGTQIGTVLGSTYSALDFVNDVSRNSFKGSNKRYGVLSGSAIESQGTLRHINIDQIFKIKLTDSYSNQQLNDTNLRSCINLLSDKALDVYKQLVSSRCGDSNVLIVSDFNMSDPEILVDEKVVIINFEIKVKYRYSL